LKNENTFFFSFYLYLKKTQKKKRHN